MAKKNSFRKSTDYLEIVDNMAESQISNTYGDDDNAAKVLVKMVADGVASKADAEKIADTLGVSLDFDAANEIEFDCDQVAHYEALMVREAENLPGDATMAFLSAVRDAEV